MAWQARMLTQMAGFKPGEIRVMMSGRQTGKSHMSRLAQDLARFGQGDYSEPVRDLLLSEGTVYGARYYCVEPVGGNWREMEDWCTDTYGATTGSIWGESPVPSPGQRWYMNNVKFWFRTAKDRDWFIIKWQS